VIDFSDNSREIRVAAVAASSRGGAGRETALPAMGVPTEANEFSCDPHAMN
jgi:hypothetical protein